ncbi:MAG: asparagine synthase (glutamine-hydrolyzing) [Desulfatibacillaceae bacterium]
MCGIAGRTGQPDLSPKRWEKVLERLAHRGPDGSGLYRGNGVTLAHTRLNILDPTEAGDQPMSDPTGRYTIVHNGEVYNYVELKKELEKRGIRFRSGTDTEVVLWSFIVHGERCLDSFNGMFAFAVWDEREQRLFLARDRMGIKPLYYCVSDGRLIFASEIKAILAMRDESVVPDMRVLAYFLQTRHNDLDRTIFSGVSKVPPGHRAWWRGKELDMSMWWDLPGEPAACRPGHAEMLGELIRDSVRLRLRSDFPVGLFLSGGVDSSGLLAAMAPFRSPVHTYNADMEGLRAGANISTLRERFGNTHHGLSMGPEAARLLPRIVWHFDDLCADPASVPVYLLSELAGREVKTVLAGEGADELFAGYERMAILYRAFQAARVVPSGLLPLLPALLRMVPPRWGDLLFRYYSIIVPEGLDRLDCFVRSLDDPCTAYQAVQSVLMPDEAESLLLPEHGRAAGARTLFRDTMGPYMDSGRGPEAVWRAMRFETARRLNTDLLLKCDAMSMAHGLECRVPYLDHRLVEAAMCVPVGRNLGLRSNKRLLRQAMAPMLPKGVARTPKENFFVPIHLWLATLRPWMESLLEKRALRRQGIFDPDRVSLLMEGYRAGKLVHARALWNLMYFQLWYGIYVEGDGERPGVPEDLGLNP